jgi:hypothetical protein
VPLLLGIYLAGHSLVFTFTARPATVRAAYTSTALVECGSGRPVAVRGVHFVVRFFPARSRITIRRLGGRGVVREAAKVCDFESDLAWAFGLDRRRPFHITREAKRVTVTFS